MCGLMPQALSIAVVVASSAAGHIVFGFQLPLEASARRRSTRVNDCSHLRYTTCRKVSSKLDMVRNIDLPEALVFYGLESMMEPLLNDGNSKGTDANDRISCTLRPGVARLLNECQEVGTAALLLSEEVDKEGGIEEMFQKACEKSSDIGDKEFQILTKSDDPVIHCRCFNSMFAAPAKSDNDDTDDTEVSDEYDDSIEFYNLQANGRSPSPAFLLDSINSVHIDPRGFGGSSGFGRGQWIEPRRSPMPARTVVFIAGDWASPSKYQSTDEEEDIMTSTVKVRCAAARAAGCRVIYLEQLPDQAQTNVDVRDDTQTMSLCDAVIDTFGNDNPRDLQPITLDAVSTPGDYWLNPPTPRDDVGNGVDVDEIVEWFRSERVIDEILGDEGCTVLDEEVEGDEMSEEEMNAILADLD
eukprot:CAMPEP_0172311282 /NCGR_PEP_ID=MMETSP1058-20130122/14497_1 /TAXON_ID=83371 /ORGANISM="Detonula confervacea, Strain CCMP 353" /LENGTH=412 /DNA_ID=CAMNT_0013024425 /DNA_START=116 /DNA_END=1354 /DNA_ORIENTATION=+